MKALRNLLTAVALLGGALTMNAQRMSTAAMQSNARFLTDRMAYTLGVTDPFLIDEMYRINYDYIWGVNDYLDDVALGYYYDDYMAVCASRDAALRTLLGVSLWNRVVGYSYFYRPVVFANRGWHFSVYDYDRYGVNRFYFSAPRPYHGGYAGGHFFRGMAPRGGRVAGPVPGVAPGYRGARVVTSAPRGGVPQGSMAPRGGQPNVTPAVPAQPNVGGGARGNATQPSGNVGSGRNSGMEQGSRSSGNVRSSSRGGGVTRTSAAGTTRTSAGASRGSAGTTRSAAGTRSGRGR